MKKTYVVPSTDKGAFTCINCSAFSKQDWESIYVNVSIGHFEKFVNIRSTDGYKELKLCRCQNCGFISFWYQNRLIWPLNSNVESPIEEMPEDIKELYVEASNILELSPKGSCAILRLALQKLCNRLANLDERGKVDVAIRFLVNTGLPSTIQKAMDTVRVIGNEAVHPGEINVDDNKDIAIAMFGLMNFIIEKMIVEPMKIDELYNLLPEDKLKGIENRDKKEQN